MSFTDYLEGKLLDHTFRGITYTAPASVYLGLFTSAPGEAGGGTELSGNGYARQLVTLTRAANVLSNSSTINFPSATADWGTVVSGGVFDALTGGNLLAKGSLTVPRTVLNEDIVTLSAGQFTITLE